MTTEVLHSDQDRSWTALRTSFRMLAVAPTLGHFDALSSRPSIGKRTKIALGPRAVGGMTLPFLRRGPR